MTKAMTKASRVESLSEMLRSADGRHQLADELEAVLFRDALDAQWPATRDAEYGGYLTDLDRRWRPAGKQTKSLEFIARQAWAYARAARLYPGRGYDDAARQGFEFLTEKMWDTEHGGFFTLVDRSGQPLEQGRKHPHGHTYAIQSFIELSPMIGEAVARRWAVRTFDWLENVAWDREHGGYWGYYRRDNQQILRDGLPIYETFDWLGTPLGLKDLNVIGDALSAIAALAASNWHDRAAARLEWHVSHYLDQLIPRFDLLPYFCTRDWSNVPDLPRCGQPMQLVAALIAATARTNRAADGIVAGEAIAKNCTAHFASTDGGYCFARSIYLWPLRGVDLAVPERSWWIQTESMRAWLLLALLQPEDAHRRTAFARQWSFIEDKLLDSRFRGFYESAEQGASARRWRIRDGAALNKISIWKDVSHEAHLLMDAVDWLRNGPGLT